MGDIPKKGTSTAKKLRVRTVYRNIVETPTIRTLRFKDQARAKPGQFIMVWIPGKDEIPMTLSFTDDVKGISVARLGEASTILQNLEVGSRLGIRGPFGNGFDLSKGTGILGIGGGCGIAAIAPGLEQAVKMEKRISLAIGARTEEELLFINRTQELGVDVIAATDDGTYGYHGYVTDMVQPILKNGEFDLIIACGPERMLRKVVDLSSALGIPAQISLERNMKCAIGICDSCSIDGLQVCRDGPVFDSRRLINSKEFGIVRRDACGRKIEV